MAETPQGSNNAGNVITWLEKLFSLIKQAGIQNIIVTIMVLFLVIVVGQVAFNPSFYMKKIEAIQEEQHNASIKKRMQVSPQIRNELLSLMHVTNAERGFILEAHNGGNNLSNLPFLYVDLTYAEPQHNTSWMEDEYKNVRLSRYPIATKLYDENCWVGSIEELKEIDMELYCRLEKEGVKYIGFIIIYGDENPAGCVGITFTDDKNIDNVKIKKELLKTSSKLAVLLTR